MPGDAPTGYDLLLPPGWWRIPAEPVAARRSIRTLVAKRAEGLPRDAVAAAKREIQGRLRELVGRAQEAGALDVLVTVDPVAGLPIAASCLVTLIPGTGAASLDDVAERFAVGAESCEFTEVAGRRAVRARRRREAPADSDEAGFTATVVEHVVPVPGGEDTLLFTWSTPIEELADQLALLFDAVTYSLQWRW